jgi:hypothetical protein
MRVARDQCHRPDWPAAAPYPIPADAPEWRLMMMSPTRTGRRASAGGDQVLAAGGVDENLVAACSGQGVMLDARMLVVGRDPRSRSSRRANVSPTPDKLTLTRTRLQIAEATSEVARRGSSPPAGHGSCGVRYLASLTSFRSWWRIRHFSVTKIGIPPLRIGTSYQKFCRHPRVVTCQAAWVVELILRCAQAVSSL